MTNAVTMHLALAFDAAIKAKLKHDACHGTLTPEEEDLLRESVTRVVTEVYDQAVLATRPRTLVRRVPCVRVWFIDGPIKEHMLAVGLTAPMLEPLQTTTFFHATDRSAPPAVDGRYIDETASLLLDKVIADIVEHRREFDRLKSEFSTWLERCGDTATIDDLGWSFPTIAGYLPDEAGKTRH